MAREFGPGSRFLITSAAVVIVVAGLRAAAPILVPLVLALYLAALSAPLLKLLPRTPGLRRIPHWVAVLLAAVAMVLVVGIAITGLTVSVRMLMGELPVYRARLESMMTPLLQTSERLGLDPDAVRDAMIGPSHALGLARSLLGGALGLVEDFLLILLLYVFALLGVPGHGERVREALGTEAPARIQRMLAQAQGYLRLKTILSLINGAVFALLTLVLGVDFPLLWGFLAFALNYIPVLGAILAAALPALLALASRGPTTAVLVVAGAIVQDQVIGRVIEPRLMGRSLGLPPLVVIVALLFWGWVFGPVGVLLAVPLTTTLKIIVAGTPDLKWLAVLGSDEPAAAGPTGPAD